MNALRCLAPYLLTALLALLVGLCALAITGTTPFGEGTICWQDNGQQVASDFGYVRGVWEGRHTLDWSFACGGSPRSSFHPTFNNLVSPLTWAVAAIPALSAVEGLSLLFLLQLTLLPLGALFYLRRRFPRLPAPLGMALALAYAFGGFVVSEYTFLPFLNVAILFPWYVAALDVLLRRGRWLGYVLLLGSMLAAGTYFAWMWLLFAAVYAAARTGWRWRSPVRQHTLTLFLASFVALLLSSFSWLPSFVVTLFSSRAGEAHFWWNATRAELDGCVLLYLFSLPFLAALLWARRGRHLTRYHLVLAVLIVGLACVSATTLWHLSRPWDFAGRFGYMADFMLLCVAAEGASRLRRHRLARLALPFVLVFGTLLLANSLLMNHSVDGRYQASADRIRLAEWAAEQVACPEGRATSRGYAAVENLAFFTPFDSLSHFTACITPVQEKTLARWGYQQRSAVISTEGGTLATDTLLGIRYILSQEKAGAPYRVQENPYYFGMGLMLPEGVLAEAAAEADPIGRQHRLLGTLLGPQHAGWRNWASVNEPVSFAEGCLHYLQQPAEGARFSYGGDPLQRWSRGVEAPPRLSEIPPTCRWVEGMVGAGTDYELYLLPRTALETLRAYGQELPVSCEYAGRRMCITCRSTEERNTLFLPLLWQNGYKATVDGAPAEVRFSAGFVEIAMPAPGEHHVELVHEAFERDVFLLPGLAFLVLLLLRRRLREDGVMAAHLHAWGDAACRRLLVLVSLLLLLWPLLTLPVGLWWR